MDVSIINDPSKYKKTQDKKYSIKASMPPVGTSVNNYMEKLTYVTTPKQRFVLTGTHGEQWVVGFDILSKSYTYYDGLPITENNLSKKIQTGWKDCQRHSIIRPFGITKIPGNTVWALFVPKQYSFQMRTSNGRLVDVNGSNVPHGFGDFIVCSDFNGRPNLNNRWVVNGLVFPETYDMRAFPNIKSVLPSKPDIITHPEFKGVTDTRLQSTAYVAGKLHEQNKRIQSESEVYEQLVKDICKLMIPKNPGVFGLPRVKINRVDTVVPIVGKHKISRKTRVEMRPDYSEDFSTIEVTVYYGDSDNTISCYDYDLHDADVNKIVDNIIANLPSNKAVSI